MNFTLGHVIGVDLRVMTVIGILFQHLELTEVVSTGDSRVTFLVGASPLMY